MTDIHIILTAKGRVIDTFLHKYPSQSRSKRRNKELDRATILTSPCGLDSLDTEELGDVEDISR